ncbi:hypothetical protein [Bradyrhizobium sp. B117]|uniref:pPIWI-associating nuclease domain-containing protein n=1 Tax=Bradyrhizobium sp. B117 TaxID=3140246 RepID=UPI0031842D8E
MTQKLRLSPLDPKSPIVVAESQKNLAFQVYDIVLVRMFYGLGLSMAGDIFTSILDDETKWRFHSVRRMSRCFDCKHERRVRRAEIRGCHSVALAQRSTRCPKAESGRRLLRDHGAQHALADAANPLRLNFFSTAMRILFEHMMGTLAPVDQVVQTEWFPSVKVTSLTGASPWESGTPFAENAKPIVFHAQMLANFNTVDELARKMLDELANPALMRRRRIAAS